MFKALHLRKEILVTISECFSNVYRIMSAISITDVSIPITHMGIKSSSCGKEIFLI
jgi:hypothetical protein